MNRAVNFDNTGALGTRTSILCKIRSNDSYNLRFTRRNDGDDSRYLVHITVNNNVTGYVGIWGQESMIDLNVDHPNRFNPPLVIVGNNIIGAAGSIHEFI